MRWHTVTLQQGAGLLSDVRGRTRSKSDLVNVCVRRFTDGSSGVTSFVGFVEN